METSEQVAVTLRHDDGEWKVSVDVGVPGMEHARALNRQTFTLEPSLAAALCTTLAVGVIEHDQDLGARLRYFFAERDAESPFEAHPVDRELRASEPSRESTHRLRWEGDRSACGHYMIQTAHIRHQGTEHRVLFSAEGGPPYTTSLAIYDTRREAKACAQRHADGARGELR